MFTMFFLNTVNTVFPQSNPGWKLTMKGMVKTPVTTFLWRKPFYQRNNSGSLSQLDAGDVGLCSVKIDD